MPKEITNLEKLSFLCGFAYEGNISNDIDITNEIMKTKREIQQDLEELEHWRNEEIIMVCGRHSGKTPKWVLATQEILKYKKAIEILKIKLNLSLNENKAEKTINAVLPIANNDMNRLTQQEYELLEEVLQDASKN